MLRGLVVVVVLLACCVMPSFAGADNPQPPASPRLTELAAKLASSQPVAEGYAADEDTMNHIAYSILELGHGREALPLFTWNAQRLASSPNMFDSLGDAQYSTGDRMNALASFKKAARPRPGLGRHEALRRRAAIASICINVRHLTAAE